jgi:extracellular factor (EF) 3-hydroxypalmitic acid methyl ester biosynthesis protein
LLYHAHCPSVSAFLIDPPILKSIRSQNPTTTQQQSFLVHRATREERFTERNASSSDKIKEASETFLQSVADGEYERAVNALFNEIAEGITSFNQLNPDIIAALQESPFLWRMQTQPRGYPGDFETIEKMFQDNQAPVGTFAHWMEEFLLVDNLSQQHRNKVVNQAQIIERAIINKKAETRAHILSLACGGCIDIRSIADPGLVLQNADFVLVDMDQGALDYSKSKLEPLGLNCSFVKGNVLRLSNIPGLGGRKAKSQRMFDAVVVGGLFDYLSDRMIVKIVKYVYWELLAIGGTLFFTNIGTDLTSSKKTFFNRVLNWVLIERSEEEMRSIVFHAGIPESAVKIEKDDTGLTYLVEIVKLEG